MDTTSGAPAALRPDELAADEQICRKCGQTFLLDEFPVNGSRANGHEYLCRSCYNARMKMYRANKRARQEAGA